MAYTSKLKATRAFKATDARAGKEIKRDGRNSPYDVAKSLKNTFIQIGRRLISRRWSAWL